MDYSQYDYLDDTTFEKFSHRKGVEKRDRRTKKDMYNEKRKKRQEEREELLDDLNSL